jgi:hypothetical protein
VDFKGRGNLCRGGPGLRDLIFNDRLTVAILTAIRRAQKFPADAYVISNRFLDLFDMRAADNLVIDKLSHRPRRLSAPAYTAILKCRLTGSGEDLVLPIASHRMGDSWRKKKSPFVATHATSRNTPAVTASMISEPKLWSSGWRRSGRRYSTSEKLLVEAAKRQSPVRWSLYVLHVVCVFSHESAATASRLAK